MEKKDDIKKYIRKYTYHGEYKEKYTDFRIVLNGWKILLDETLSKLIEKEYGLKYKGNLIWAGEWEENLRNHRVNKANKRKVIKAYLINNEYATFQWGWCFNFIPKVTKENVTNCRTEKTIYLNMTEHPKDFIENTKNRQRTIIEAHGENINDITGSLDNMKKSYYEAFKYVMPEINEYFERTKNYRGIIIDVIEKNENDYYKMIRPDMMYTQIFLENYLGLEDKANRELEEMQIENKEVERIIKNKLKEKPLDGFAKLRE